MKNKSVLSLILLGGLLPALAGAQTIDFTTQAPLTVISGDDKLGIGGSTITITNSLQQNQAPVVGTSNQYSTTITATDPSFPLITSISAPATVTINYVGPNSPSNSIGVTASATIIIIKLTISATVLVPSLQSSSPGPIANTTLTASDTLTISDSGSDTTYSMAGGTISSIPEQGVCLYQVSPAGLTFPVGGGSLPVNLTVTGTGCSWTASPGESWLSLNPTAGTSSQTVEVIAEPNTTGSNLTGSVTIAGQVVSVAEGVGSTCTFTVTPASLSYPSSGGATVLDVTASQATCAWTASSDLGWLTLNSAGGTGSGSVTATAALNTGSTSLTGTISVAGQSIPVAQATSSSCAFTVTPLSLSYTAAGSAENGPSIISVVASSNSCVWTASSDQTWDTLSASGGIGTGTVALSVASNGSGSARSSTLTIAGQSVSVTQSNINTCTFTVSPSSLTFSSTGGTLDETITTADGCAWSVSGSPTWVTLGSTSGVGSGSIAVTASSYGSTQSRSGTLIVAGISIPVTQTSASGCSFQVSPASLSFPGGGGSLGISVTTSPNTCSWTASSPAGWVTLSSTSGTGSKTITAAAVTNTTNSSRSLTLDVAGQNVAVTEAPASCSYGVNPTSLSFAGTGGSQTVQVEVSNSTCIWSASSSVSWATVSPTSGTGAITVQVSAATNITSSTETGSVTIAGIPIPVTVSTNNGCTFTVSPAAMLFPNTGGAAARSIVASAPSCAWTASAPPWVTLSATGGTGSGSVDVTALSDVTGATQSGSVILAGQAIPVTETGGCTFTVTPTSVYVDSNGSTVPITVTANPSSCAWTAAPPPFASFTAAGGTGSASTGLAIATNGTGADLTGTAIVAGQSVSIFQAFTPQTFADVTPNMYFFDAVNLLAAQGVTSGCTTTDYCPGEAITRADVAIFIVRAAYGGNNFNYSQIPVFNDVPVGSFGFQWIQQLYALGITTGCGNGDYCPNESVTRDQMAVLLIKARYGATTLFTYSSTPLFADVPSTYWAFPWIQRLGADGITTGCSAGLYCPTEVVTRGEMAIFVMRALYNQLLPPGTSMVSQAAPNILTPGQSQVVTLTGLNTNWVQGTSALSPIPGVLVGSISVETPTVMSVTLIPQTNAPVQPDAVLVITGSEQDVLPNGIAVQ